MIPVCAVNVTGLVFNIYCLKLVDASYFQVARGLTLPMTVVLQSLSTGEKPTMGTIASCGLVTWGFTYSFLPIPVTFLDQSLPEGTIEGVGRSAEAPMLGMIFGVASAAMIAIHAVLVKSAMKRVEGKTMDLAYWQNTLCAIVLVPGIVISREIPTLLRTITGSEGGLSSFVIGSGLTVCLLPHQQKEGSLMRVIGGRRLPHLRSRIAVHQSYLPCHPHVLVRRPLCASDHPRRVRVWRRAQRVRPFLAIKHFTDERSNRIMSIFLILCGSTVYTWVKSRSSPSPAPTSQSDAELDKPLLVDGDVEKGSVEAEKFEEQNTRARGPQGYR